MNQETFPVAVGTFVPVYHGVCMALLAENGHPVYSIGACKEYVLDYTLAAVHKGGSIYCTKNHACLKEVRLAVYGLGDLVLCSLDLLNRFENALDIPPTQVYRTSVPNLVVFRGDKRWMMAPPLLSLYALLVRVGRSHQLGKTLKEALDSFWEAQIPPPSAVYDAKYWEKNTDRQYMKQAKVGIECILRHGDRAVFGEDMKENWEPGTDIHNRGIIAYSEKALKVKHPEWYKFMEKTSGS